LWGFGIWKEEEIEAMKMTNSPRTNWLLMLLMGLLLVAAACSDDTGNQLVDAGSDAAAGDGARSDREFGQRGKARVRSS